MRNVLKRLGVSLLKGKLFAFLKLNAFLPVLIASLKLFYIELANADLLVL